MASSYGSTQASDVISWSFPPALQIPRRMFARLRRSSLNASEVPNVQQAQLFMDCERYFTTVDAPLIRSKDLPYMPQITVFSAACPYFSGYRFENHLQNSLAVFSSTWRAIPYKSICKSSRFLPPGRERGQVVRRDGCDTRELGPPNPL
jgi:hypothetical protein